MQQGRRYGLWRRGRPDPVLTARPVVAIGLLRDQLGRAGALRIRSVGRSMWPTIRPGDVLHVEPAHGLRPGDVVVGERGGHLFAHRVENVTLVDGEEQLITRGDARFRPDPPTQTSAVIGRVERLQRGQGSPRPVSRRPALSWPLLPALVGAVSRLRRMSPVRGG